MKLEEEVEQGRLSINPFRSIIGRKSRTKYLTLAFLLAAGVTAIENVTASKVNDEYMKAEGVEKSLPTYLKADYIRSQTNYQPNFWVEMVNYHCDPRK